MGKSKPARWKATRTKTPAEKARLKYYAFVTLLALPVIGIGWGLMDYSNQTLGWVFWAIVAIAVWAYVCRYRLPEKLNGHVQSLFAFVAGVLLIGLLCTGGALYMRKLSGPSNADLMTHLLQMENHQESRLNTDYPLGYIMIAFSGHHRGMIPRTDDVEADWEKMTVSLDAEGYMFVEIPHLFDKRSANEFTNCAIGTRAVPGAYGQITLADKVVMRVECLEARPVGIFAVLGFKEYVDPNAGKQ